MPKRLSPELEREVRGTTLAPVMGPPGIHQQRCCCRWTRRHLSAGREAAMTYREVRVYEVREALRLWLRGEGLRSIERMAQLDRKTVRRYVAAAEGLGLARDGGEGQLTDELIGSVVEAVRPHRSDGDGAPW